MTLLTISEALAEQDRLVRDGRKWVDNSDSETKLSRKAALQAREILEKHAKLLAEAAKLEEQVEKLLETVTSRARRGVGASIKGKAALTKAHYLNLDIARAINEGATSIEVQLRGEEVSEEKEPGSDEVALDEPEQAVVERPIISVMEPTLSANEAMVSAPKTVLGIPEDIRSAIRLHTGD